MNYFKPRAMKILGVALSAFVSISCFAIQACGASDKQKQSPQETSIEPAVWHEKRKCVPAPIETCSAKKPCTGRNGEVFNTASKIPGCAIDGAAKSFINAEGNLRYYCQYDASKADSIKRPLVIFLHGGSGEVLNLYKSTDLRSKAQKFQLGKGSVAGFHLVGLQSRNIKLETGRLKPGRHFDTFWWDFRSPSSNPDLRDLDQLINEIVTHYSVDSQRIYLIGWSEGGMLATYYGIARHKTPSPFGHKIAAAANYSASSPFDRRITEDSRCAIDLDFQTSFPIYTASRTCDIVACNKEQEARLWARGSFADTIDMETWTKKLRNDLGNSNVTHQLIDGQGNPASACQVANECSLMNGLINHLKWPKNSEDAFLNFLKGFTS